MSIKDIATQFVDACDSGKGWSVCKQWCHEGASFSCQADALADLTTVEAYVGWAADLLGPIPDGGYELLAVGVDDERNSVTCTATFTGTNTGEGPVPPTGKKIASNYVYVLQFEGDRIRQITKVWNDGHALKQLGWA
jgi:predicted ester cyclase